MKEKKEKIIKTMIFLPLLIIVFLLGNKNLKKEEVVVNNYYSSNNKATRGFIRRENSLLGKNITNEIIEAFNENNNENNEEEEKVKEDKELIYIEEIEMPKEHQKYLFKMCKERSLDYLKVLAIIKNESQFKSDTISETNDYGYMQINKINHNRLSQALNTRKNALDPYININWGTFMLKELYDKWKEQGINNDKIEGKDFTELDEYVFSSYNKGLGGFKKHGKAKNYIKKVNEEFIFLINMLKNSEYKQNEKSL